MEVLTLCPLSQGELAGGREAFVDAVFGVRLPEPGRPVALGQIVERLLIGGFPEAVLRSRGAGGRSDAASGCAAT